jgi:restriction endonuclease Mrr
MATVDITGKRPFVNPHAKRRSLEEDLGGAGVDPNQAVTLIAELLDSIRDQDFGFFEKLVLDVLQAMGYGGRRDDAAERLGQSGDEGVDGVIREDRRSGSDLRPGEEVG